MRIPTLSIRGALLVGFSLLCTLGIVSYTYAVTNTGSTVKTTVAKKTTPKLTCNPGSAPNARKTKCNVCEIGNVSSNGLSCRACRGNNIASSKGATACTPCLNGTKANKAHTACIKQRYVSGEKK